MKVLVIGAAGMIGARLAARIAADGGIGGRAVDALVLADVVEPPTPAGRIAAVETRAVDLSLDGAAAALVAGRPDVVFHLAAIVSGEAEADLEKGYRINLDGTRALLDAIRLEGGRVEGDRLEGAGGDYRPRLVYASSIAVFGPPFPPAIPDDFALAPLTSYGTQKAVGEMLLADYSRRGILDGIGLRLPTICVRPGRPNKAASGFFSNILREPMAGEEAVLPVGEEVRHFFASPRAALGFFLHAAAIDLEGLGARRSLNMPGLSATVGEEIEALRRVAGEKAVRLIRRERDETIARIVAGWAGDVRADQARALGFSAETSFDEIVRAHLEDELGGTARA